MRCAPFKTAPDEILFSAELFTHHARSILEQVGGQRQYRATLCLGKQASDELHS